MTQEKFFFRDTNLWVSTPCPSCGGDGLYKRRTSYTENGKPICFRCQGSGEVSHKMPKYSRLYKVTLDGITTKLVPASERPSHQKKDDLTDDDIIIPF